jgi:hypothetical protein
LAVRATVIVDRRNARSQGDSPADAVKQQRQNTLTARKHARALERALLAMLEDLHFEGQMIVIANAEETLGETLEKQFAAVESLRTSIGEFLEICVPIGVQDHADPILWLAWAAHDVWHDVSVKEADGEKEIIRFGRKPDSPLVHFIRLALEGIGLAGDDPDGYSHDTISDHLRGRQNRPRKR